MESAAFISTSSVDNVILVPRRNAAKQPVGGLYITAQQIIFSSHDQSTEVWIRHQMIDAIAKKSHSHKGIPLRIRCKDFRELTFLFPRDRERECQDVYESLTRFAFPATLVQLDAFKTPRALAASEEKSAEAKRDAEEEEVVVARETESATEGEGTDVSEGNADNDAAADATSNSGSVDVSIQPDGWSFYSPEAEFARMGVPNDRWRLTSINANYAVCPSYSTVLYVPTTVSDNLVEQSAKFRSKGRFPALCYVHQGTEAVIARCSQPLAGVKGNRSLDDEQLVQAIFEAMPLSTTGKRLHYIVDARPRINAMANRAKGAGYESTAAYHNCRYMCMGIDNIHVMRDSLSKLIEACRSVEVNSTNWWSAIESSGWLKHIKIVLDAVMVMVRALDDEGCSILLHCSDGWDRTAQLSSLTQLLLDPYCRTIYGFQTLVEKEWLSFGHKFLDRCGFLTGERRETSPVFTQFLDCVWQLSCQFPSAFEFNENFLIQLHDMLYSCEYGTFLGNNERERKEADVARLTQSVWTELNANRDDLMNPLYLPMGPVVLRPSTAPAHFTVWPGQYLRWTHDGLARESALHRLMHVVARRDALEARVYQLRQYLRDPTGEPPVLPAVAQWEAERRVHHCHACSKVLELRRRHCRLCGAVVCVACSKTLVSLPEYSAEDEQGFRACRPCLQRHEKHQPMVPVPGAAAVVVRPPDDLDAEVPPLTAWPHTTFVAPDKLPDILMQDTFLSTTTAASAVASPRSATVRALSAAPVPTRVAPAPPSTRATSTATTTAATSTTSTSTSTTSSSLPAVIKASAPVAPPRRKTSASSSTTSSTATPSTPGGVSTVRAPAQAPVVRNTSSSRPSSPPPTPIDRLPAPVRMAAPARPPTKSGPRLSDLLSKKTK